MKRILLFATLISLMAFSCEKDETTNMLVSGNTCTVNNPVEELAWLKAEIQHREQSPSEFEKYFDIQQAEYNQQTVFIYNSCCPVCTTSVPVYNCQGELLFYGIDKPQEAKKIKNIKIIWQPKDYACVQ